MGCSRFDDEILSNPEYRGVKQTYPTYPASPHAGADSAVKALRTLVTYMRANNFVPGDAADIQWLAKRLAEQVARDERRERDIPSDDGRR